jgi:crotonobetainyl-CoA:carnitine CoA-transferase CaiB-like acyl-CoA transferase
LVPVIAERWAWYDAVDELEPSFFVDGEIPPVYPDHFVARVCAVGALALLIRREHTASGGALSVSQAESILNVMPEFFLSASMNGDVKPDPKVDLADFPHFSDAF